MTDRRGSSRLRLQLGLGGLGALVWYAGVVIGSEFLSGVGVGLLVSALGLRFLVSTPGNGG